jgi:hypothetical protein
MFGFIRRKKPFIHHRWILPLIGFQSDPEAFYKSIEEELALQEIPELTKDRIHFKTHGILSAQRTYLRLRRERVVLDIASAPFGKAWYFSLRAAELPRRLSRGQFWLTLLFLAMLGLSYWHLFGLVLGGIVLGSSFLFLFLLFVAGNVWGSFHEALLYTPFFGFLYERFRRDTYDEQDRRYVFGQIVMTIVSAKVKEFCAAGGVDDAQLSKVDAEQILTEKEQIKYGYKVAPRG